VQETVVSSAGDNKNYTGLQRTDVDTGSEPCRDYTQLQNIGAGETATETVPPSTEYIDIVS